MKLTQHELELFRHNGFIKLPTRIPEARVEALRQAALADFAAEIEPVSRLPDGTLTRISNVWGRGDIFRGTIVCDEILDPLECLLGPNIEFMLNRHNHIYLRDRDSTASLKLHRDCYQWSRPLLSVLLYLEDTHLENGCTLVIPGTHHLPAFWNLEDLREDETLHQIFLSQTIPIPMPAGGLLAMDGLILHAAGLNRTERTRMSMTLGYHSVDHFSEAEDSKRILIRGERVYEGNDRRREKVRAREW